MRTSLILSVFMHLAILLVAILNFATSNKPAPDRPIAVEILNPGDVSRMKAGVENQAEAATSAPKSAPEEKKPETQPASAEPRPADKIAKKLAMLPPPKPSTSVPETAQAKTEPPSREKAAASRTEPPPVEQPKPKQPPAPVKKPQKTAERKPNPEPKPDAEEREVKRNAPAAHDSIANLLNQPAPESNSKRQFDPKKIAALLNRDPTAGAPPQDGPKEERPKEPWRRPRSFQDQVSGMDPDAGERPAYGHPAGHDDRMSANEINAFIAQVSRCWTPPVGGLGAEAIIVRLHIELNEDGRLARAPQVANSSSSPFFTPAADSAVRAVLQCEPYRMPPEKYSQWRDMLLNFDPRQMYGG